MTNIKRLRPVLRVGQRTNITREFTLVDGFHNPEPLDLTDAESVTLSMEHNKFAYTAIGSGECDIVDAEFGSVEYEFSAAETSLHGRYRAQFEVEWEDGETELIPPQDTEWVLDVGRRIPETQPLSLPKVDAEEATFDNLQVDEATITALTGGIVGSETLDGSLYGPGLSNDNGNLAVTAEFDGIEGLTNPLVEHLNADGYRINDLGEPQESGDAARKSEIDDLSDNVGEIDDTVSTLEDRTSSLSSDGTYADFTNDITVGGNTLYADNDGSDSGLSPQDGILYTQFEDWATIYAYGDDDIEGVRFRNPDSGGDFWAVDVDGNGSLTGDLDVSGSASVEEDIGVGDNVNISESSDGRMDVESTSSHPSELSTGVDLMESPLENATDVQTQNLDLREGSQRGINVAVIDLDEPFDVDDDDETVIPWGEIDDRGIGVELENGGETVSIPPGSYNIQLQLYWDQPSDSGESRAAIEPDQAANGPEHTYAMIHGSNDVSGFTWSTHSQQYFYGSSSTREFEFIARQRTGETLELDSSFGFNTRVHIVKIG